MRRFHKADVRCLTKVLMEALVAGRVENPLPPQAAAARWVELGRRAGKDAVRALPVLVDQQRESEVADLPHRVKTA